MAHNPGLMQACINESLWEGAEAAVTACAVSTAAVLYLNKTSLGFQRSFGVSGKVSFLRLFIRQQCALFSASFVQTRGSWRLS